MTYYKYVKREAGSQINWAEVGKNMSDMLLEERDIREKKKADIDAATREFQTILDNSPESEHKGMAEFTLDFTSNMQKAYLMQDKLLKSGGLSLRDYTIQRQNMVEGVNNTFNLIKNYNADFLVAKEKLDAGQLSKFSTQMMERVESFGQITNSKIFINPTDFKLSIAKTYTDEDGVEHMSDDPNEHATVDSLKVRTTQLIDVFDVKAALAEDVSYLASVFQEAKNHKAVKTLDDLRQNPKFEESMRDTIESVLTNQMNAASILADNSVDKVTYDENGNEISREEINWEFTEDPEEAASDVRFILVETNPDGSQTPKLTEEQMNIAGDWVDTQLEMMIQKKEEARQEFAPRSRTSNVTGNRTVDKDKNFNIGRINNAVNIIGGTEQEFESAIRPIVNRYKSSEGKIITAIDRITEKKDGVDVLKSIVIEYYNPNNGQKTSETINYNMANGEQKSVEDLLKELYSEVYTGGSNFEESMQDFERGGNTLITSEEFDISDQEWEKGEGTYDDIELTYDVTNPDDIKYEDLFAELPTGYANYEDAATLVHKTIQELRNYGVTGGTFVPTVAEMQQVMDELGIDGTPKNKDSWRGKGWINPSGSTNILVFKINGEIHGIPYQSDNAKLWGDFYDKLQIGILNN